MNLAAPRPEEAGAEADQFEFVVRYRAESIDRGRRWLDYSKHPATKLGLHNALLAMHDRIEILEGRGERFVCQVFVARSGVCEPLTQAGAERLFAELPHGRVRWTDLCRCLLPPLPARSESGVVPSSPEQLPLFPHTHTGYDDLDEHPARHALDVAA